MKYLTRGSQCNYRLSKLLKLRPKIKSASIIKALEYHLVLGYEEIAAADLAMVPKQNLARALKSLESAAKEVEEIKEFDLYGIKSR